MGKALLINKVLSTKIGTDYIFIGAIGDIAKTQPVGDPELVEQIQKIVTTMQNN